MDEEEYITSENDPTGVEVITKEDYTIPEKEEKIEFDKILETVKIKIMVYLTQSDYHNSSKKNNIVSPRRASHGGIATSKKIKLPTQNKSKKVFCRSCNKQNTETAKICIQCECTMSSKPMRRKMK